MARFAILGVLLMFLLALSEASVYQTIITTTEIDEPNPYQSQSCRRQVSRMRMDSCRRLVESHMLFPQMDVEQMQRQCCQQLQEVSQECMCEAVRQIAQSSAGSQGGQQQQMQEMMRKAQQLPMMCGMRSPPCKIYNTHQSTERCRRQLSGVRMDSCRRYLQPEMLLLPVMDRRRFQQQCCEELQEVNPECTCEAIRQTVQSLTGSHGGRSQQQQQMQEMMWKAQQLPMMCGVQSQPCQIYEVNTRQSDERCRRQLTAERMDSCTRYLQPQILLLPTMDIGEMQQQQQCCQELQGVNPECVCEAIRLTVQALTGPATTQDVRQQQEVMRKAQQLPRVCGIQTQSCEIRPYEY